MKRIKFIFLNLIFLIILPLSTVNGQIVIKFEAIRYSYTTEQIRIITNPISPERKILENILEEKINARIHFLGFEYNNNLNNDVKEQLNPYIGKDFYELVVDDKNELIKIIRQLSSCPSGFDGISLNLMESIIVYTVRSEDVELMRELLLKDGRQCASEIVSSIFCRLKNNKKLYLRAFGTLSDNEQRIAVITGEDMNTPDTLYLFNEEFIKSLDDDKLKASAKKFNILVEEWGKKGLDFYKDVKK